METIMDTINTTQFDEFIEQKTYFTICIDNNGYYKTGNDGIFVQIKEMPTITNISQLFAYKYNEETLLLELDEDKLAEIEKEAFQSIINTKLEELSVQCQEAITDGIEYNGDHFSYTLTDQNNISNTFQLAMSTGLSVPYHADGQDCRLYSKEEIMNIYFAQETNVTHHTTYYNQLKQYVLTLTTEEEVNAVEYGQELTGTYLETYNKIMAQASMIANTYVNEQTYYSI